MEHKLSFSIIQKEVTFLGWGGRDGTATATAIATAPYWYWYYEYRYMRMAIVPYVQYYCGTTTTTTTTTTKKKKKTNRESIIMIQEYLQISRIDNNSAYIQ